MEQTPFPSKHDYPTWKVQFHISNPEYYSTIYHQNAFSYHSLTPGPPKTPSAPGEFQPPPWAHSARHRCHRPVPGFFERLVKGQGYLPGVRGRDLRVYQDGWGHMARYQIDVFTNMWYDCTPKKKHIYATTHRNTMIEDMNSEMTSLLKISQWRREKSEKTQQMKSKQGSIHQWPS